MRPKPLLRAQAHARAAQMLAGIVGELPPDASVHDWPEFDMRPQPSQTLRGSGLVIGRVVLVPLAKVAGFLPGLLFLGSHLI